MTEAIVGIQVWQHALRKCRFQCCQFQVGAYNAFRRPLGLNCPLCFGIRIACNRRLRLGRYRDRSRRVRRCCHCGGSTNGAIRGFPI